MTSPRSIPAMRLPLDAELILPGSKSHANRSIICAALAEGTTEIRGATACDDVEVMVANLKTMGFRIEWTDKTCGVLTVHGGIPQSAPTPACPAGRPNPSPEGRGEHYYSVKQSFLPPAGEGSRMGVVLDCHNAGTTIRFLTSLAALVPGDWTLTGDRHMQSRPIHDLTSALRTLGTQIDDKNGCPPLRVQGGTIIGSTVELKADVSSQYLSSLLMIAPVLPHGLTIRLTGELASEGYVELTMKTMADFGIKIDQRENTFIVQHQRYTAKTLHTIEGDWSSAGPWLVLEALSNSRIRMPNLSVSSQQSDRGLPEVITRLKKKGNMTVDVSDIPDQLMNLAVLAAYRDGTTKFVGAKNLRVKECDRLHVLSTELFKAGVSITEQDDGVTVIGGPLPAGGVTLDPHDDHRMAMCFAILGLMRGGVQILNPDCVKKSYPSFFADLEGLIQSNVPVTIVGMRGVGKSSLGRKIASKLNIKHEDSDHLFEDAYGPIKLYISKNGWDEFRKREEEIIESALRPGIILSVGGGSLTSKKTRKLVKDTSVAIWLQAREAELVKRLKSGKRPALTSLPLEQEVRKFLLERGPHYREVAKVEVSPTIAFGQQVPFVLKALSKAFRSHAL